MRIMMFIIKICLLIDDLEVSNIYIYKLNKFVKKIISKVKL